MHIWSMKNFLDLYIAFLLSLVNSNIAYFVLWLILLMANLVDGLSDFKCTIPLVSLVHGCIFRSWWGSSSRVC